MRRGTGGPDGRICKVCGSLLSFGLKRLSAGLMPQRRRPGNAGMAVVRVLDVPRMIRMSVARQVVRFS
jgi:hypothetical protein